MQTEPEGPAGSARLWAILLVAVSALCAFAWFAWNATRRDRINFLPRHAPAEWIVYPTAPQGTIHPSLELGTIFRRSFTLPEAPPRATLSIAALRQYSLSLNGRVLGPPDHSGKVWKQPDLFDVSAQLRAGQNQLIVTVVNTDAPPALWLSLEAGRFALSTGETWEASYGGASWQAARLAAKPLLKPPGSPFAGGERPWASLQQRWPTLLLFLALSAAGYWLITWRRFPLPRPWLQLRGPWSVVRSPDLLLVTGMAGMWIALFAHNLGALPSLLGYDVSAHIAYIRYIQDHRSLPLASEGWEMFQPPLYYLLSAGLLGLLGLSVADAAGIVALRIMGLVIGVSHFIIVWAALRLLFPNQRAKHLSGVALGAFLPPLLYLSHYITNEALAAALVSLSVYLCLRILKLERASCKAYTALGLCLGAALVTKMSALLAAPPICGALLWKGARSQERGDRSASPASSFQHPESRITEHGTRNTPHVSRLTSVASGTALVVAACLLICGWHYARVWLRYGSPLIGVWDPKAGFAVYPDGGYQTSAYYLRFGEALRHPWFSGLHSFADGIYSTLWGDALSGGRADLRTRPPWNYQLMAVGYGLALVPTLAVLAGAVLTVMNFIRQPSAGLFLVLALGFVAAFSVVHMSMAVPYYCMVKAFYGFSALIPLCAFGAAGLDALGWRRGKLYLLLRILLGVWAINSYSSFWISRSSPSSLDLRAEFLAAEGRFREAEDLLRASLAVAPHDTQARLCLTHVLTATGDLEEATKQTEIVARDAPDEARGWLNLAAILARRQRFAEATEQAQRAVALAPGLDQAWEHLVVLLVIEERYKEVIQVSRQGLANFPFSPVLRFGLAAGLAADGEPAQAIAHYRQAIALRPDFQEALSNLAWLLATRPEAELRDGAQAVELAERACELTAYKLAACIGTLAAAYAEAGRFADAAAMAEHAHSLAEAANQKELAAKSLKLQELYRSGKPYREISK
ncbi:MAG: hypothetical protein DME25_04185 [Verrucomicrobia bacterium]|nr:MAG: hypothetical protein DME25_04185 [Verrucomicrobiota bacterium]